MTLQATETSVRTSITVEAPIARAFTVFTEGIGTWWPPAHHILEGELAEMVFEPHVGGAVIDRAVDGRECRWAQVLAYEPPDRVLISWDISLQWQIETDPEKTSEVEVRFTAEGPNRWSSSSTAISTATATAGSGCARPSARRTAGASSATPRSSTRAEAGGCPSRR